ncbi:uncharacterized protein C22orf15 homolog isoform X2 [Cyanistes caeruleus]|uniref:uncharacterized protein C22orf15 homolog isoform X2 n=1 Tax=Cyanistes caeruleus TaxID=156563 RepID=UPI000CDB41F0|nr:uncharacterized protein C22orf15 homolog isoform X2 [Cyanistes caeruleus]
MFATVRFGDCIDLVDEKGILMNLSKVGDPASEYASKYLQGRQRYILIRVVREENSEATCYESLLEDLGKHYPDLPGKSQAPTSPPQRSQGCRHDSCSHLSPHTAQWDSPLMPLCSFRALMAPREGTSQAGVQDPLLVKSDTPHQAQAYPACPPGKGGHLLGTNREGRTSGEIVKPSRICPRL